MLGWRDHGDGDMLALFSITSDLTSVTTYGRSLKHQQEYNLSVIQESKWKKNIWGSNFPQITEHKSARMQNYCLSFNLLQLTPFSSSRFWGNLAHKILLAMSYLQFYGIQFLVLKVRTLKYFFSCFRTCYST